MEHVLANKIHFFLHHTLYAPHMRKSCCLIDLCLSAPHAIQWEMGGKENMMAASNRSDHSMCINRLEHCVLWLPSL